MTEHAFKQWMEASAGEWKAFAHNTAIRQNNIYFWFRSYFGAGVASLYKDTLLKLGDFTLGGQHRPVITR